MKILHLCLIGPVTDGWNYQDNLLPKFHKKLGYDVEILTSYWIYGEDGKLRKDSRNSYLNENGIKVTRIPIKKDKHFAYKFKQYEGLLENLEKLNLDILFIHGCQFVDMKIVVKFLQRKSNIKVYVDNHADFSNSATNWISKNILHKIIWKHQTQLIEPYVTKFYGVLPARVDFLVDVYGIPKEKCELLVLGADDELVERADNVSLKHVTRIKHNIEKDDFLIVTGGKIDNYKRQTIHLLKALKNINNSRVRLIIFGTVIPEMKEELMGLVDGKLIQHIGWLNSEELYTYFSCADLVVFPGGHSVLWEQAVAQGKPMICNNWNGVSHIDFNGNIKFLYDNTVDEIEEILSEVVNNYAYYEKMRTIAESDKKNCFLYSDISKLSIS